VESTPTRPRFSLFAWRSTSHFMDSFTSMHFKRATCFVTPYPHANTRQNHLVQSSRRLDLVGNESWDTYTTLLAINTRTVCFASRICQRSCSARVQAGAVAKPWIGVRVRWCANYEYDHGGVGSVKIQGSIYVRCVNERKKKV
jgi:hypothetical protein